jgi:hypothetical protein
VPRGYQVHRLLSDGMGKHAGTEEKASLDRRLVPPVGLLILCKFERPIYHRYSDD